MNQIPIPSTQDSRQASGGFLHDFQMQYVGPACLFLHRNFEESPTATVFFASSAILGSFSAIVFTLLSVFSVALGILITISTGIILTVALQGALLIAFVSILLIFTALSAAIAASIPPLTFAVETTSLLAKHSWDFLLQLWVGSKVLAPKLLAEFVDRAPKWRDTIIRHASEAHSRVQNIPLREWSVVGLESLHSIPWTEVLPAIVTATDAAVSVVYTGFSIVRLCTSIAGMLYKFAQAAFLFLQTSIISLRRVLSALQVSTAVDVGLTPIPDEIGEADGGIIGVSTSVACGSNEGPSRSVGREVPVDNKDEFGGLGIRGPASGARESSRTKSIKFA